jgi:hypothetical protein
MTPSGFRSVAESPTAGCSVGFRTVDPDEGIQRPKPPETKNTMKLKSLLPALAITASIAGTLSPAAAAEWLAGIAANGRLVVFPSDDLDDVTVVQVRGLQKNEELLGLDLRPATGELYALGSTSQLYTIDWQSGQATAVGVPFSTLLAGEKFAFDFNPTVDRIRIMSDSGQNLRAHPVTGAIAFVDASLAYAAGDSGFASVPAVSACAYTNSDNDPATGTTLYDIDTARDVLVLQNPPNAGTLITVGALGVDVTGVAGFDIAVSTGTAYASLIVDVGNPKAQRASLYSIDLATGAATALGKIGGPKPLTSLTALGPVAD